MPYPRYVSEPLRPKLWEPDDQICRWCLYYKHAEVGVYWINFRCGLDDTAVDMWGTCDAFSPLRDPQRSMMSAHEKAVVLAKKGDSYHMTR